MPRTLREVVYVDGLRGPPAKGHTVEIKQEDKQFNPSHAVVQVGRLSTSGSKAGP